jgi:hypothetical protein
VEVEAKTCQIPILRGDQIKGRTAEGPADNYHHVSESFVSRIPGGRRGSEKKRRDGEEGGRMKKKRESERERKEGRGRR